MTQSPNSLPCRRAALRIALRFSDAMLRRNLKISVKTLFLADGPTDGFANELAREFRRSRLPIRKVNYTEDLGADAGSGKRRHVKAATKRHQKAKARAARTRWLGTLSKGAARGLYATGVKPQGTHHAVVSGASPAARRELRKHAVESAGPAGVQLCHASLIAFVLGPHLDAEVFLQAEQAATWFKIYASLSPQE